MMAPSGGKHVPLQPLYRGRSVGGFGITPPSSPGILALIILLAVAARVKIIIVLRAVGIVLVFSFGRSVHRFTARLVKRVFAISFGLRLNKPRLTRSSVRDEKLTRL